MADDDLDLRRARPEQDDLIARQMSARVRAAIAGGEVEPVRVGRFIVLDKLGSGGMGVVFAAFDPRLDRRVALKVLHAKDHARVLAEARALAKLSHPNVVAVYDASDLGDDLFIAMELVDGTNLRTWAKDRAPTSIVAAVVNAGRGLAAAHAAGLVHGDIKPENILVGDGVVKVADFGLAGAGLANAGTPAYMAPEQRDGRAADARSDQYALAVTLYEALAGKRPDKPEAPPGVSPRIGGAIARSLAPDPTARFASVDAMLEALAPRRSRRWPIALLAVALLATALIVERGGAETCGGGSERVATVLAPARGRFAPRAAAVLDDYGAKWASMTRETCEATRRGEQSDAMLDLRMACLDHRLDEIAALATAGSGASPDQQITAAFDLAPLAPCADRDQLAGVLPPPPELRVAVDAARKELTAIAARQKTTDYAGALADAHALADRVRGLGYAPLAAAADNLVGKLEGHAAHFDRADDAIKRAIVSASAAHDDAVLADLWATRVFVAMSRGRYAEAYAYGEAGDAAAAHLASSSGPRGLIRLYVGEALAAQDRLVDARASVDAAQGLLAQALGPDHPRVAEVLTMLCDVQRQMGDRKAARATCERAVRIFEAAVGHDHQDVAVALGSLASVVSDDGDLEGALAIYRDALARVTASAGPSHVYTASAHANVGSTLRKLMRNDEARAELAIARDIYAKTTGLDNEQALLVLVDIARLESDLDARRKQYEDILAREIKLYGEHHHRVGDRLVDLGNTARDAGDLAGAAAYFRRALAAYEAALGPTDAHLSIALSNLGDMSLALGKLADAADACTRALAIDENALGKDHPDLAYDLTCIGEAKLGTGDAAGARDALTRALALRTGKPGIPPQELARTKALLAKATAR